MLLTVQPKLFASLLLHGAATLLFSLHLLDLCRSSSVSWRTITTTEAAAHHSSVYVCCVKVATRLKTTTTQNYHVAKQTTTKSITPVLQAVRLLRCLLASSTKKNQLSLSLSLSVCMCVLCRFCFLLASSSTN